MKRSIVGALVAALAAAAFSAVAARAACLRGVGYAHFATYGPSLFSGSKVIKKKGIDIDRESARLLGFTGNELKFHLVKQKASRAMVEPDLALGKNCYVGYAETQPIDSHPAAELAGGVRHEFEPEIRFANEPEQLKEATSCRAVSG